MKFLLCPDKFKGSATSEQVINAMQGAVLKVYPDAEVHTSLLSDGGEGFALIASKHLNGEWGECESVNANHTPIIAKYFIADQVVYMDMASTNGLDQIPANERNPNAASTQGLGEMIRHACSHNSVKRIYIGLGGSATNDGGAGMAHALGVKFYDADDNTILPSPNNLKKLAKIDRSECISTPEIIVACDVNNPLLGENGASYIYGPQKGIKDVNEADQILKHYITICDAKSQGEIAGAGAAGGSAFGLLHFLDAQLMSGFQIVSHISQLEKRIKEVDIVITGEGSIDAQTLNGKGPHGLALLSNKHKKPIYAVAGHITAETRSLFTESIALSELGLPIETCIKDAQNLINKCTYSLLSKQLK